MIYSVNYMDLTEKISPLAFAKYLKDMGWEQFQSKKQYIKIFQYEKNDAFFQVVIPTEKKLSDYREAMYKAVVTVAEVENKSVKQIMLSLLNPITPDYYQPIETTIEKLKDKTNKPTRIIGRIKKLESSPDVQKRKIGKITVVYLDGNDERKTVTVNLEKNDYDKAIRAHERGSHVEIVGEISGGRKASMSCESFAVIE